MQRLTAAPACGFRGRVPGVWVWVIAFSLLAISTVTPASGQPVGLTPAQEAALEAAPLTQYRAYRRMRAVNDRLKQHGWLEAWTELDSRGFRYEIVAEGGSGSVRNRVLKAVLQREQELIAAGQSPRADLSSVNYEFGESGMGENGTRFVVLKPRRKDILLVHGRMVLNQEGTDVLRIEGRMARNPSFWTSLVEIVREFARLDGVRVPVSTTSVAKLKLAGVSKMDVSYEYESINGRPLTHAARRAGVAAAAGR